MSQLCEAEFDLIWAERLTSLRLVPPSVNARVIVDLDDLEHRKAALRLKVEPFSRIWPLEVLEVLRLRAFEQRLLRLPYEFAVCSEGDRQIIGGGPRVHILPNGADLVEDRGVGRQHVAVPTFTFVGHMAYQPNVDAVCFFEGSILPLIRRVLPEARFVIVGHHPHRRVRELHDGATVFVTGSVPEVSSYLRDSAVSVAPIRFGAGTRIKILEALAHGTPVVSTTIGAQGLDVEDGRHLLVADSAREFADACVRIWRKPRIRAALSAEGLSLVRRQYDWALIEARVKTLALGERPLPPAPLARR